MVRALGLLLLSLGCSNPQPFSAVVPYGPYEEGKGDSFSDGGVLCTDDPPLPSLDAGGTDAEVGDAGVEGGDAGVEVGDAGVEGGDAGMEGGDAATQSDAGRPNCALALPGDPI